MNTGSSSFSYLTENIPDWTSRLDDLSARILSRQVELSQLASSNAESKSASADRNVLKDVEQLKKLHNDQQRRRKRKTASISSAASGSQRYRTRSMVIVYYDSSVQETFETLVRGIGTARNNIRKAKMSARMKNWSALAGGEEDGDLRSRFMIPRTSRSTGGEKTVYDTVDATLETAQSQCETGAHQFLRDGDCRKEIDVAKKKLEEVRVIAVEELDKAKEEERKTEESETPRQPSPDDEGIEVEDDGDDNSEYQLPLDWRQRYARA
ncbi:hypothetical protein FGG08_000004 [Glutinoglossum americanum]|uniref:Uncharacterized protein n=1 Tax=Glutinoglossum americanum TaxID=1670608 RepID=A0A9P8IE05_9PEZI|nr:hypothetical protein FGG08_000004 [Glutinoglossum americanum]